MDVFVSLTCALFVVPKIFLVHLMFFPSFLFLLPVGSLDERKEKVQRWL